jgi:ABC-2 type transport system ATP-binding protein
MRQRLGVAQALVHQPDLLVLDEPMNGLDPKGMREFREMILSLREKGVSVLVSSHQLSDIEQIADHLIVVQKGKVTHQVAMAELKAEKNVLIIKTDDNAETEALLKASFEVEVLQVADELQVTLATDQRSAIAAAIVTAGIGLKELRTKQSSLEDTFLAWTEEGGL